MPWSVLVLSLSAHVLKIRPQVDLDMALGELRGMLPGWHVSYFYHWRVLRSLHFKFLPRNCAFNRRQEPPSTAKDADAPADPQLHVPFVGFHDDSDSLVPDHQVISDACVE